MSVSNPPPAPTSEPVRGYRQRIARVASLAAFVYLTSTIVVMASERAYWYWTGINADAVLGISVFYLLPTMAALWALALTPARGLHQVALAAAILAIVVEGVLTPVIYLDGPLPLMAFMFIGWHGLVAFLGFWYLVRTLLIQRRHLLLATSSAGFGAAWGVWALASSMADPLAEDEILEGLDPTVLNPGGFARYALAVGAILAVSHWLIGFVWPARWTPSVWSTRLIWLLCAGYMSIAVLPAIFWAPVKLLAMVWGTWWLLKRSRSSVATAEPTVLRRLAGRVPLISVTPILAMPAAAALVYAAGWQLSLAEGALQILYGILVGVQVIAGGVAFVWAARRATRRTKAGSLHPASSANPR